MNGSGSVALHAWKVPVTLYPGALLLTRAVHARLTQLVAIEQALTGYVLALAEDAAASPDPPATTASATPRAANNPAQRVFDRGIPNATKHQPTARRTASANMGTRSLSRPSGTRLPPHRPTGTKLSLSRLVKQSTLLGQYADARR
jgi:hypothetical protein